MQTSFYRQVHEGMEVLDVNGEKIGMCGEPPFKRSFGPTGDGDDART